MPPLLAQAGGLTFLQWALERGVQGVLALACLVMFHMIVRLYKEKNQLHRDRARLEKEYRQNLAQAGTEFRLRVEELEADFRKKVEQLLREQVKIAKETTATLVEATAALKSISTWLPGSDGPPANNEDLSSAAD